MKKITQLLLCMSLLIASHESNAMRMSSADIQEKIDEILSKIDQAAPAQKTRIRNQFAAQLKSLHLQLADAVADEGGVPPARPPAGGGQRPPAGGGQRPPAGGGTRPPRVDPAKIRKLIGEVDELLVNVITAGKADYDTELNELIANATDALR